MKLKSIIMKEKYPEFVQKIRDLWKEAKVICEENGTDLAEIVIQSKGFGFTEKNLLIKEAKK